MRISQKELVILVILAVHLVVKKFSLEVDAGTVELRFVLLQHKLHKTEKLVRDFSAALKKEENKYKINLGIWLIML